MTDPPTPDPPTQLVRLDGVTGLRTRASWWRRARIAVLATVGGVVGLGAAGIPVVLVATYLVSFTLTATPDSGFNVLTLGAVAFMLVALGLLGLSLVLLIFRATRPLAIGYLVGVGLVVIGSIIATVIFNAIDL